MLSVGAIAATSRSFSGKGQARNSGRAAGIGRIGGTQTPAPKSAIQFDLQFSLTRVSKAHKGNGLSQQCTAQYQSSRCSLDVERIPVHTVQIAKFAKHCIDISGSFFVKDKDSTTKKGSRNV